MDVASILRLNIRRRGGNRVVYADCPLCGDRRGRLGLYPQTDTWRCFHCGEYGGMLPLYGKVRGVSNSTAYREICDTLSESGFAQDGCASPLWSRGATTYAPPAERAPDREVHKTLTALLSMLTLTSAHRNHLRTVRGLTDAEIDGFGFKSTPPPKLCHSLTEHIIRQGCTVQGVPGFYLTDNGTWTVKFYQRTSGILIPILSVDGLLHGMQIRLDHPIRRKSDPPDKLGAKYLPLTSAGKNHGVTSGSPIHFVGDPNARVVYVTEGPLKADIAHTLTNRTFAALMGANSTGGLDGLFAFLSRNGTEEIIESLDMDKHTNEAVRCGANKVQGLARKHGMACRQLNWDPRYKGIDDWQLALRRIRTTDQ